MAQEESQSNADPNGISEALLQGIKVEPVDDLETEFDIIGDAFNPALYAQTGLASDPIPFRCHQCGKVFKQKQHLSSHFTAAHKQIKSFQCSTCHRTFSQKTHMDMHKCHSGRSNAQFNCNVENCDKVFKSKQKLTRHKANVHKMFECPYCSKTLKSNSQLKGHMYTCNQVEQGFKCVRCGVLFKEPGDLISHIRTSHEQKADFECEFCGKQFGLRGSLKNHVDTMHSHLKKQNFKCHLCGLNFSVANELKWHHIAVHKLPQEENIVSQKNGAFEKICTLCNKVFQSDSDLRKHIQTSHGTSSQQGESEIVLKKNDHDRSDEKATASDKLVLQIQSAKCDKCHESFTAVNDLIAHVTQAHPEVMSKPSNSESVSTEAKSDTLEEFECDCGKTFPNLDDMNNHTCQKSFSCHLCEMTFYFPEYLRRHLASQHQTTINEFIGPDNPDEKRIKLEPPSDLV